MAATIPDASALTLDLLDPDAIAALAADQPVVDILVNNAGTSIVGPFVQSDPAEWDALYRVNLLAPMLLTHAVLPGMLERTWGRIVFVSTDSARIGAGGEVGVLRVQVGAARLLEVAGAGSRARPGHQQRDLPRPDRHADDAGPHGRQRGDAHRAAARDPTAPAR